MKYWFDLIIKSQGARLYIGALLAFITALSGVALLMLSGWFITATAITGIAISAGLVLVLDMYMPGSGIRFFALSRTVGRYVERIYNHDTILRLISIFRLRLFKTLSSLPIEQLRSTSDSEWLSRLTADLDALDSILLRYIIPPLVAALLVLALTFFLSFIWFELAMYLGSFMLLCLILSIRITTSRTKQYSMLTGRLLNESRADIIEHLKGSFELQSYGLMEHHEEKVVSRLNDFYEAQAALNSHINNIQFLLDLVLALVMLALIIVGLLALDSGLIDGPIMVMLVMMFVGASEILQSFPSQFSAWGKTDFSANRLTSLANTLDYKSEASLKHIDAIDVEIVGNINVAVSLKKPLSFKLTKHDLLNVRGRSGSGKSTLASLLIGAEQTGEHNKVIINNDLMLNRVSADHWYTHIAYLEQSNSILAGTLGYNLALGVEAISEEKIWSVLKMVELDEWANALPQGLNSWLGETGGKVSGGQARRICFARLLLREPELVILDEPFNGIDHEMAARIWVNILPWISSRMTVLLTHERPDYLSSLDQVSEVCLDDE